MTITKNDLLMGRDKTHPHDYTKTISDNLDKLLIAINQIADAYDKPMKVSSGWRPPAINNKTPNAAKGSNHQMGLAVDIHDDGKLRDWVLQNLSMMKTLSVYCEDFRWTKGWVHFQIVPPSSRKRIFIPYSDLVKNPMTLPNCWNGKYDKTHDG